MNSSSGADTLGRVTKDGFLGGAFHLLQPAERGFRSGHDALLLAACIDREARGRALDMGAGTGAVGFAAAALSPRLSVDLAERDAAVGELARRSSMLRENANLAPRLRIAQVDLLSTRPERERAGLFDGAYDIVMTNPPFHPAGGRASPDPLRRDAKAIPSGGFLDRWMQVAAALLRHGGRFAMICRPENLRDVLPAADNRFGAIRVLPLHPAAHRPAQRILLSAVRGSRLPLSILPSEVLDERLREAVSLGVHGFANLRSD